MKSKIIYFVMLLVATSLIATQGCKKLATLEPKEYLAAMPGSPVPSNEAVLAFTGANQAVTLTWTGTASTTPSWTVFFGTSDNPPQVATNVTTNSYTAHIGAHGGVYYWYVETTDNLNITTTSPVWSFDVNSNPNATTLAVPANNATAVSCTPTLKWKTTTDPEGDDITYDLYLGTAANPAALKSGITDTTYAISTALLPFTDYYWKVVANDPFGGKSVSAIWKFTTGALPITKFTGSYNADEPAEAYSYGVGFTMVNSTTISCDNYWNSGWVINFVLDLTKYTYSFPLTTFGNYSMIESGVIDPVTGGMVGTYTIFYKGKNIEQGVHTYTHL